MILFIHKCVNLRAKSNVLNEDILQLVTTILTARLES